MVRSFRWFWTTRNPRKRPRTARRTSYCRPQLEGLEDRTVPSISFSGPGNTGAATLTGMNGPDAFVIQLKAGDATMIEFSDDNGMTFTDAALSDITAVQVNGLRGPDLLRINETNGFVAKAGGLPITFDGGQGYNVIAIRGDSGEGASISETFTPGDGGYEGTLLMTDGTNSATITAHAVNHLYDTSTAANLTVNTNDQNNFIHIGFGLTPGLDGVFTNTIRAIDFGRIDANGGQQDDSSMVGDPSDATDNDSNDNHGQGNPTELHLSRAIIPFTYANKTNVTVNGLGGDDLFLVNVFHAATGEQSLTLDGGTGFNVAAVRHFPHTVTLTLENINRTVTDPASIFIHELYMSRLGRPAEDAAVSGWVGVLNTQGAGAVVSGIENSIEGRLDLVHQLYVHYLGRVASDAEAMGWVAALMNGMTEEQVISAFLSSNEFFNRAQVLFNNGNGNQNFASAMYQVVFNRSGSGIEVTAWAQAAAGLGRGVVANAFVASPEFRTNAITALYSDILHRLPGIAELIAWVSSGMSLHDMRVSFLASPEAFANE